MKSHEAVVIMTVVNTCDDTHTCWCSVDDVLETQEVQYVGVASMGSTVCWCLRHKKCVHFGID